MIMTKRHLVHYFSLFAILLASVFAFHLFAYDRLLQMAIIIAAGIAYVAWGIVHHKVHDDLKFSVVVEYAVFAILGVVIVAAILFQV